MIEGQEGVTWDEGWLSLALACEEHGFDGLFRSDHYLSTDHLEERGRSTPGRRSRHSRRSRSGCGSARWCRRSDSGIRAPVERSWRSITPPTAVRSSAWAPDGSSWSTGRWLPVPSARHPARHPGRTGRDHAPALGPGRGRGRLRRLALPARSMPVAAETGAGPAPAVDRWRRRRARSTALAARWADEYNVRVLRSRDSPGAARALRSGILAIGRDPDEVFSLMTRSGIGVDDGEARERTAVTSSLNEEGERSTSTTTSRGCARTWPVGTCPSKSSTACERSRRPAWSGSCSTSSTTTWRPWR